ncbi:alpha-aminoadipic semialdehyde synthase, mitochondrial-like isoform X1 [Macrosteles quadrilineatus]|uniref:alpha-aminoadipic semialdehyde synthase, mitochondrial-like isoform X1 n=2 Tax=Macrosteles quadrilineatus TaxID=74068 RepID=UPI0023E32F28|nr:alpha-aminoadipic semialdehyde synthase, mitochondrial-like isoform X1 [Macrosteles quadrilineatus]
MILLYFRRGKSINTNMNQLRLYSTIIQKAKFPLKGKVMAIRREDQSVWERRAPLAPSNVRKLVRAGVKVLIQPSNRRAYPVQSYINAGAIPQEDISEASVIFGVKQVPADLLLPNKTYCMFSHTIKAQESNMPLLDACLEKNIRLVDYEKLVDELGHRIVAFGKYAGVAGMVNILHGLGLRLLALGHHTPFMHIGPAHNYRNSSMATQAIRDAGYEIALGMMPKSIGPLIFVFTGSGNVSQGAQEIFQELPHEYVPPSMLQKVAEHGVTNKVYGCQVRRRDHLQRREGGGYDPQDYDSHPELYMSTFGKKIAPYASVIVNGIYWAVGAPKLLTLPDAKNLLASAQTPWLPVSEGAPALPHRTLAICDISADPGGSIEFMNECTTIDTPFCLYDADRNKEYKSFKGAGLLVCSIDNMPTQLPRESTDFFGDLVMPYAVDILQSDATKPLESHNFDTVVANAIIASNGKLTPKFEYIQDLRQESNCFRRSRHKMPDAVGSTKKILVLGAGRVSSPLVKYLNRDENVHITLGSSVQDEVSTLANQFERVEPVLVDVVRRPDHVGELVQSAGLVVSLLPFQLHHLVAEACITHHTHMVTASYCTLEMMRLHEKAVEAGVTVVNEVGLDPGIDHLLAMECIDEVHQAGGKVESYVSYCGGLPAPEHSNNPLRYKFSWSPRGVLLNVLGNAKYLENSKVVEVAAGGELLQSGKDLEFLPGFALEGYPNRDSLRYSQLYGVAAECHTMFRGTLRYRGFLKTMEALKHLGLIDLTAHPALHPDGPSITWRELMCTLLGLSHADIFYENLKGKVSERVGEAQLRAVEQLGVLDDVPVVKCGNPLDSLSHYLSGRLSLGEHERDVVILRHVLEITWSGGQRERRDISMVEYGDGRGTTAMARTVGLPAAIAAKMVLDGEIQEQGMVYPLAPHIYRPMLSRLKAEGIVTTTMIETID